MGPSLVFYAVIADAVQRVRLPCSSSADLAPPHTPIARLRPGSHLPKRAEPHHVLASGGDGWHSQRFDRLSPIARLLLQQVFPLPDGWISEIPSGIKILGVKSPLRTTLRWSGTIAYRFNSGCWQSLCRPAMLYQGGQLGDLEDGISFLVRKDVLWALEILESVQILQGPEYWKWLSRYG